MTKAEQCFGALVSSGGWRAVAMAVLSLSLFGCGSVSAPRDSGATSDTAAPVDRASGADTTGAADVIAAEDGRDGGRDGGSPPDAGGIDAPAPPDAAADLGVLPDSAAPDANQDRSMGTEVSNGPALWDSPAALWDRVVWN